MSKLISYKITNIDPKERVVTFEAVFSDKHMNKTKRMHYGLDNSLMEITRKDMGAEAGEVEQIVEVVEVGSHEQIDMAIKRWAEAYVKTYHPPQKVLGESNRLVGKTVAV